MLCDETEEEIPGASFAALGSISGFPLSCSESTDLADVLGFNFTDVLAPAEGLPPSTAQITQFVHGIRILLFARVGVYCRFVNGTASAKNKTLKEGERNKPTTQGRDGRTARRHHTNLKKERKHLPKSTWSTRSAVGSLTSRAGDLAHHRAPSPAC